MGDLQLAQLAECLPGLSFRRPLDLTSSFLGATCGAGCDFLPCADGDLVSGRTSYVDLMLPAEVAVLDGAVAIAASSAAERHYSVSYQLVGADGALTHVREQGSVVEEAGEQVVVGYVTRSELEAGDAHFQQLAANASELIAVLGEDGRVVYLSPAYLRVLGYRPEDLIGQNAMKAIWPKDRELLGLLFGEILRNGSMQAATFRMRHRDGHAVWMEGSASSYRTRGVGLRIVGVASDVTERRESELALERQSWMEQRAIELSRRYLALGSEEFDDGMREGLELAAEIARADRCELVFSNSHSREIEAIYRWSAEGIGTPGPTDEQLRAFSWGARQLATGKPVHIPRIADLPPEAHAEKESALGRGVKSSLSIPILLGSRYIGYLDFERITTERAWTEDELSRLSLVSEIIASAAGRHRAEVDLTQQLEFEMRIAALSQRLLDLGPEDVDDEIVAALADAAELAGADRAYLMTFKRSLSEGVELHQWAAREGEAAPAQVARPWATEKLLAGEALVVPDVSRLPPEAAAEHEDMVSRGVLSLLMLPVMSAEKIVGLIGFESIERRRSWSHEHITLLRLAGELLTTAVRRKRSVLALRASESQLLQSQKMEAVGRLAGGIAHDFNNILMIVMGNAQVLLEGLPPGDPAREDAQEIYDAGERAAALTRQLLAFTRRPLVEPNLVDLSDVVTRLEPMLSRLIGETIELETDCDPELDPVRGNTNQLEQVVINLVVNARDAMREGGRLLVRTRPIELSETEAVRFGSPAPGGYALLEVLDDGTGMDAETVQHAFEPFFTTKGQHKGTGLGLSMVYNIVRRSGGSVSIESKPGKGTCVSVLIRCTRGPVEAPTGPEEQRVAGSGETVLLVEDEHAVRRLMRGTLERAGYRVIEAENGARALELAASFEDPIDVLVTDLVMPGMRGDSLARRLRRRRPRTRILFVTGYPEEESRAALLTDPSLQKPFTEQALLRRIRSLLDGDPA